MALAAWVGVRFSLASSAAVLERLGPVQAMRRSARLVEGAWWRVLGFSVVGWLIAAAVSWVIQTVFQLVAVVPFLVMLPSDSSDVPVAGILVMVALFTVGFALSQIVGSVFPSLVQGLIYIDRRIRTENLAASLAESAGVTLPAPGTAPYTGPYTGPYGPPPRGLTTAAETAVPAGIAPGGHGRLLRRGGGQTLKPRARSCSRPSSVILSGPHGGIQTQLMRRSLTMPSVAAFAWSSMTSVSGRPRT